MTIRSDEAARMLADVENVVAKLKQSQIYRNAALIIMLWGLVNILRDGLIAIAPAWFGSRWLLIDAVGVAGTIAILSMSAGPGALLPRRTLAAFVLFYAFGWIWADLYWRFHATPGDGVLADFVPVRLRGCRTLVRGGLQRNRPCPHRPDPRRIPLVGRGFSTVHGGHHRRRLHPVRPLDAAGLKPWRGRTKSSINRSAFASWRR